MAQRIEDFFLPPDLPPINPYDWMTQTPRVVVQGRPEVTSLAPMLEPGVLTQEGEPLPFITNHVDKKLWRRRQLEKTAEGLAPWVEAANDPRIRALRDSIHGDASPVSDVYPNPLKDVPFIGGITNLLKYAPGMMPPSPPPTDDFERLLEKIGMAGDAQPPIDAIPQTNVTKLMKPGKEVLDMGGGGLMMGILSKKLAEAKKWGHVVDPEVVDRVKRIITDISNGQSLSESNTKLLSNADEFYENTAGIVPPGKLDVPPLIDIRSIPTPSGDELGIPPMISRFMKAFAPDVEGGIHRYSDATNTATKLHDIDPEQLRNSGFLSEQMWRAGGFGEGVPIMRNQMITKLPGGDLLTERLGVPTFTSKNLALPEFIRGLSKSFRDVEDPAFIKYHKDHVYAPKDLAGMNPMLMLTNPEGNSFVETLRRIRDFSRANPDYKGGLGYRVIDKISPERILASYNTHPHDDMNLRQFSNEREIVEASKAVLERARTGNVDPEKWRKLFFGAPAPKPNTYKNPVPLNDAPVGSNIHSKVGSAYVAAMGESPIAPYMFKSIDDLKGEKLSKFVQYDNIEDAAKLVITNVTPDILHKWVADDLIFAPAEYLNISDMEFQKILNSDTWQAFANHLKSKGATTAPMQELSNELPPMYGAVKTVVDTGKYGSNGQTMDELMWKFSSPEDKAKVFLTWLSEGDLAKLYNKPTKATIEELFDQTGATHDFAHNVDSIVYSNTLTNFLNAVDKVKDTQQAPNTSMSGSVLDNMKSVTNSISKWISGNKPNDASKFTFDTTNKPSFSKFMGENSETPYTVSKDGKNLTVYDPTAIESLADDFLSTASPELKEHVIRQYNEGKHISAENSVANALQLSAATAFTVTKNFMQKVNNPAGWGSTSSVESGAKLPYTVNKVMKELGIEPFKIHGSVHSEKPEVIAAYKQDFVNEAPQHMYNKVFESITDSNKAAQAAEMISDKFNLTLNTAKLVLKDLQKHFMASGDYVPPVSIPDWVPPNLANKLDLSEYSKIHALNGLTLDEYDELGSAVIHNLPGDVVSDILNELSHGNKISAIKLLQKELPFGLKLAKDIIESKMFWEASK